MSRRCSLGSRYASVAMNTISNCKVSSGRKVHSRRAQVEYRRQKYNNNNNNNNSPRRFKSQVNTKAVLIPVSKGMFIVYRPGIYTCTIHTAVC
jgi:hypothetical protein